MYWKGIVRLISKFFGYLILILLIILICSFTYTIITQTVFFYNFRIGLLIAGLILMAFAAAVGMGSSPSVQHFYGGQLAGRHEFKNTVVKDYIKIGDYRLLIMLLMVAMGFIFFMAGLFLS